MSNNTKTGNKRYRVIDFFCGAGGFSEGFRQQGFDIVMGVDNWQPAIESHNLNHDLQDSTKDVLDFWGKNSHDVADINRLPDTELLIGSPSCVSFSMSNKAGKADKTSGINLIESYLRIVAVKRNQKKSILKGWYMENVPQSRTYIKEEYKFKDLNLSGWAKDIGKSPNDIALRVKGAILNAGDYGAPQERKRFIAGEWVETGEFLTPEKTHHNHVRCCDIKEKMPTPNIKNDNKKWNDPNYPSLVLETSEITDHFYDTGLYEIEWEKAEYLKTNHPFMGKMFFPENEARTSRTILATRSAASRESIIYSSEYKRKGNGEYRLPTIREIASLMGFPYAYQFVGSEGTKCRQIGNAVCPHMSGAIAKSIRKKLYLPAIEMENLDFSPLLGNHGKVNNLNTFEEKVFDSPKKRKQDARFRRHPLKAGNITVDLMNYHPDQKDIVAKKWYVVAFFGTGCDHKRKELRTDDLTIIKDILEEKLPKFKAFYREVEENMYFIGDLQSIYENDLSLQNEGNPLKMIKKLSEIINSYHRYDCNVEAGELFPKKEIPLVQLMAMYGLLKIIK